ncbi:uncharacterized protein I206_100111 [Kwoniella pini CBS 10737]|uniref:Uncharacterized protein n=1 Tax=Kwoniella pini CBS 10737 TaxID=1296096 RepID=A0A1B9IE44_9TREE|nr:uncharacterized protein I206_01216 [Kwoniella pini CBS 10737]OCF53909.1 hypothetical protein I206_01216 [Kwoniella pini CBS 10737]
MPSELLHLPPLYTLVGLYRLVTDPFIRQPVLDKIKHASVRGLVVGGVYAAATWKVMDWFVEHFLVGEGWNVFKSHKALEKSSSGVVNVGIGRLSVPIDIVLYTHLFILLPQLSSILRYFIYKNLKIARSRAFSLTVSSRGKPHEFWSQGYIEEWAEPPKPASNGQVDQNGRRVRSDTQWIEWLLWWPTQLVLRKYLFLPLSPSLPLLAPLVRSFLRSITTGEYLHQPYFDTKGMSNDEIWRWVEERRWAYRAFGFAASLVESIPIVGLFFSISNRIGAAMWAFDLEKRQHLFSAGVIKPLPPTQVGFYGMGKIDDLGVDIQKAEEDIDRKFSKKSHEKVDTSEGGIFELKGEGLGSAEGGKEKIL